MSNVINSASGALLGITTIVTNRKNPANTSNYINGAAGSNQTSRIPVNLGNNYNGICNLRNNVTNKPQPTVTNTSSLLRKRASQCTGGINNKCGASNFKLQNPLNFTASAYINRQSTKASQCEIDPNSSYKDFKCSTSTLLENGVETKIQCSRPIVKVTNTPSTSTFLRTTYFKNNCLPQPNIPKPGSVDPIKIMPNNNCGTSQGGC